MCRRCVWGGYVIDIHHVTNDLATLLLVFFNYLGQLGNCIFIVCSSYFLLENKTVNATKVYKIIIDNWVISFLFLSTFIVLGIHISSIDTFKNVFPITFETNWFVGCYILFYLIHPLLNLIIRGISRRELLLVVSISSIFYLGVNLIGRHFYYYNKLIGFILIYFVVALYKQHQHIFIDKKQQSIFAFLFGFVLIFVTILSLNYLGLKVSIFVNKIDWLNTFVNPVCIITSLALLNYAVGIKRHVWAFINSISSMSLLIYIIHENYLLSHYIKPEIWRSIYGLFGYEHLIILFLGLSLMSFLIAVFISYAYKNFVGKQTAFLADKFTYYSKQYFLAFYNTVKKYDNKI